MVFIARPHPAITGKTRRHFADSGPRPGANTPFPSAVTPRTANDAQTAARHNSLKKSKKFGRYWHFNGGNQRLDERVIRLTQNLPWHRCRCPYAVKLHQSLCRPAGYAVQHRCFRSHRSSTCTPRTGHYRLWRQTSRGAKKGRRLLGEGHARRLG